MTNLERAQQVLQLMAELDLTMHDVLYSKMLD